MTQGKLTCVWVARGRKEAELTGSLQLVRPERTFSAQTDFCAFKFCTFHKRFFCLYSHVLCQLNNPAYVRLDWNVQCSWRTAVCRTDTKQCVWFEEEQHKATHLFQQCVWSRGAHREDHRAGRLTSAAGQQQTRRGASGAAPQYPEWLFSHSLALPHRPISHQAPADTPAPTMLIRNMCCVIISSTSTWSG